MPGPARGQTCTVCRHAQVDAINAALDAGTMSHTSVAKAFSLHKDAVNRHVNAAHATLVQAPQHHAADAPDIPEDATPYEQLKVVTDWLRGRIGTGNARADEIREYRMALKDLKVMSDLDEARASVGLSEVEGLEDLLMLVAAALENHPDERERFVAELRTRGLDYF
jgi:hypothetical protein